MRAPLGAARRRIGRAQRAGELDREREIDTELPEACLSKLALTSLHPNNERKRREDARRQGLFRNASTAFSTLASHDGQIRFRENYGLELRHHADEIRAARL
jgi:hypothetical protein